MANNILEKLEGIVSRFEEVSTLITDPSVIADQKRYVTLTKEYKNLEDLVKARKEYIDCCAHLEEAKEMARKMGPDAYIAVINEGNDAVCVDEIDQDEF